MPAPISIISSQHSRQLLLTMAQQRSVDGVLQVLVQRLHESCGAALARVWLLKPTSTCGHCRDTELCRNKPDCLHLVSSAGHSLQGTDWSSTHGDFTHIPLGFGKVGHIAATKQPVEEKEIDPHSTWIARPDWAAQEKIRGLIGQPLLHQDELLGVLAVFTRETPSDDDLAWLRAFADHAAAAIANSRAFEEIQKLRSQLELENEYLRSEVKAVQAFGEILAESPALKNTLRRVEIVASTDATVLIQGESGTGKELIARAIHEHSQRSTQPMVTVNCAAIPPDLFESEFFGHVQGSFSGATRDRQGRFALADRGTLLLDEVGEIPLAMQGKLLRVLEQGTFERVGDERTQRVDVRVIAATNRDLIQEVAAGRFRKDLYYRLSVFTIEVAPLRDRLEDLRLLAQHFVDIYCRKYRTKPRKLTRPQLDQLESYSWPGNVRELRNVIERAVITQHLEEGTKGLSFGHLAPATIKPASEAKQPTSPQKILTEAEMRQLERQNLIAVLQQTQWKVSGHGGAAEILGVHPATLASRLRALKISRSNSAE